MLLNMLQDLLRTLFLPWRYDSAFSASEQFLWSVILWVAVICFIIEIHSLI